MSLHYHKTLLHAARQRQQTDEFKDTYRLRAAVERKIAELTEHGSKQARYIGTLLSFLPAQWMGAVVNLKRLFKLFQGDMIWNRLYIQSNQNVRDTKSLQRTPRLCSGLALVAAIQDCPRRQE